MADRKASLVDAYGNRMDMTQRKSSAQAVAIEKAIQNDRVNVVSADELSDADRKLAELGYTQVYKREFSWLSCISFAFAISGLFASVSTTFIYPLEAGGLPSAVWCWFICGGSCMTIALSVSELCSAYPTSGGLYFTCKYVAPQKYMAEISWLCGWLNILGQIAGLASSEYGSAQLILAAVEMNSSYVPTDRQTVGVSAALTVFHCLLNSLNTKWLEKITKTYVIFHIAVLVTCCIALLALADHKHSTTDVWTNVQVRNGWSPPGWSFMFGFLSASWTMTDYDATAHIAEEIKDPAVKAPWAITIALGFTYIGGWLFTIVLAYCAGNVDEILMYDQPVAQIFKNVGGIGFGVTFTVCAFIILNFTCITALQSCARTFWALSRDELLPLSRVWYKTSSLTHTPLNAVWLSGLCSCLLNLIGLGSYTAISAIFNITAIALDWSYCIPIVCKMITGAMTPGPYHLGKFSYFINLWAVLWTSLVTVIFMFPTVLPATKENMNYCIVVLAGILAFAVLYWYIAGRKYYIGPRVKAQLVVGEEPSSEEDLVKEGGEKGAKGVRGVVGKDEVGELEAREKRQELGTEDA